MRLDRQIVRPPKPVPFALHEGSRRLLDSDLPLDSGRFVGDESGARLNHSAPSMEGSGGTVDRLEVPVSPYFRARRECCPPMVRSMRVRFFQNVPAVWRPQAGSASSTATAIVLNRTRSLFSFHSTIRSTLSG